MAGAGLQLLQCYDDSQSEASSSDSDDDGVVVTINRRVVSGSKRSHPGSKNSKDFKKAQPRIKGPPPQETGVVSPLPPSPPVSTLLMAHYDLGQGTEGSGASNGLVPVPRAINDMFLAEEEATSWEDDPALHEGRTRSFQHAPNSWASYVYLPLEGLDLDEARDLLVKQLDLEPIQNPHLSLSRVVSLRHHWLEPLMKSLGEALKQETSFHLSLDRIQAYVNDEGTRTFVGLTAGAGWSQLSRLSRKVDSCLSEYNLPPFYRPPSFHCSLAWCLGDKRSSIRGQLEKLSLELVDCMEDESMLVKQIHAKAGNKLFKFKLA